MHLSRVAAARGPRARCVLSSAVLLLAACSGERREEPQPLLGANVIGRGAAALTGSSNRPYMVRDINTDAALSSAPSDFIVVDGKLFFVAEDRTSGRELWTSDGTEAGTVRVKDIRPGPGASSIEQLTNVDGTLFFAASDGTSGKELWKSDGTEAGTVLLDVLPGPDSSSPTGLTNVNGTLYFSAIDPTGGRELWKTDGTASGTLRVKDIWPGASSSTPAILGEFDGTLFFSATDGTSGRELWKSDGTEAGTVRVKDI